MNGLGKKVSYFRKTKGYTVKELANNLCDESTLYRFEQGKQIPRLEILNDICLKLEIPLKALFPLNEEVDKLKNLCRESIYMEDYLSLEIALEECNKVLDKISSIYVKEEFRRFIQWHRAIIIQKRDNRPLDALHILNTLANINNCGSELDINILNSIGLIHLSLNDDNAAYKIYRVINNKIIHHKVVEDSTILPRVGYNYAHTLFNLEEFHEALKIITEVLYYLEKNQLMYSLGKTYHMKGFLSQKCGYIHEAIEDFQNSILVFTLTKEDKNLLRAKEDLADIIDQNGLLV
ncbi:helix-turn-helix transcriptional regulator [Psychrobacillus psychrodurans]|jgi:transcriptional regulator with XRE-family HTH domain|uniref:helix-turn-helix domain-containing protein n=1 Tax=Psychrobacillus psychrodurans TaxID=126157 RepID=UPI001F4D89D4|nr:helix-turn-helix transcriptional regulator [Psychrobacillus psychrodurans]MCK1999108.1 helix-turn-helix transcriptional regulator [Psychrobacillus psychrodurans]